MSPPRVGKRRRVVEQELVRDRIGRDLPRHRDIAVGLERAVLVFGRKLDADILALGIIERGEHEGLPELAVVDEILRFLVISIDAGFQSGKHLLHDADVVDVRALRPHRTVQVHARLLRRVLEQGQIGRRGQHLLGRREGAGVPDVEGGALERLPGEADARAELIFGDIFPVLIEADAGVQREAIGEPPFVLQIKAGRVADQTARIDDRERRIDRIAGSIERLERIGVGHLRLVGAQEQAGAQRVRLVEPIGDVAGYAVGKIGAKDLGRHPVEDDVADRVGNEMH